MQVMRIQPYKRHRRKLQATVLIVLLMSLLLVGCTESLLLNESPKPSVRDERESPGVVTLRMWHTYSDQETAVFEQEVIPLFERQYPNIRIEAQFYPYSDQLRSMLIASVGTTDAPDLMRMDIAWVPEYAKLGILTPIDEREEFAGVVQDVFPAALLTAQYKERYYGVPINTNTKVAIYHKRLLEEAGFKEPPATFEQLIGVAAALREKNAYAIGAICCTTWDTLPYFWSFGGQLTSPDYTYATGFLDSDQSVQAVEKMFRLVDEGVIGPSFFGEQPGSWEGMEAGQYMMIDNGPWYYTLLMDPDDTDFDVFKDTIPAPFPADIGGRRSIIGGENLVMLKGSKYPDEAWTFMQFMTTKEPQTAMVATGLLPTNMKAAAALDPANPPYLRAFIEQMNQSLPRPPVPNWSKIEKVYARYMELIMRKEMPIREALQEAARQIDRLLREQ